MESKKYNTHTQPHEIPFLNGLSSVSNSQSRTAKVYTSYLTVRSWFTSFQISGGVCVTVPARRLRLSVCVCEYAFHLARPKSHICYMNNI